MDTPSAKCRAGRRQPPEAELFAAVPRPSAPAYRSCVGQVQQYGHGDWVVSVETSCVSRGRTARRVDRLQLLEVELGNRLQLLRQARSFEIGRELVQPARYSSCRLMSADRRRPPPRPRRDARRRRCRGLAAALAQLGAVPHLALGWGHRGDAEELQPIAPIDNPLRSEWGKASMTSAVWPTHGPHLRPARGRAPSAKSFSSTQWRIVGDAHFARRQAIKRWQSPVGEIALSLRGSNRRGHPSVRAAHSTGNYEIGRTLFTPVEIATFRPRMSSSTRTRPESSR
jgi:hypothetical protein